jgi:hypothetical protein
MCRFVCVRERVPSASREGKLPGPAAQVALRSNDGQVRGVQIWGLQWQRKQLQDIAAVCEDLWRSTYSAAQ